MGWLNAVCTTVALVGLSRIISEVMKVAKLGKSIWQLKDQCSAQWSKLPLKSPNVILMVTTLLLNRTNSEQILTPGYLTFPSGFFKKQTYFS